LERNFLATTLTKLPLLKLPLELIKQADMDTALRIPKVFLDRLAFDFVDEKTGPPFFDKKSECFRQRSAVIGTLGQLYKLAFPDFLGEVQKILNHYWHTWH
jgi:hypothetical protein